jgi:GNAT superfamily N-acetyltransferase
MIHGQGCLPSDQGRLTPKGHFPYLRIMKIELKQDAHPDPEFYYYQQFKIYHEPYLIWDRETWEAILSSCTVYRIEVDSRYAGDVILEKSGRGARYIVDFSLLPEYQGKGTGKAILEELKKMAKRLTAVTRKETLPFFLKCGFVLSKRVRSYYGPGVDGYAITYHGSTTDALSPGAQRG